MEVRVVPVGPWGVTRGRGPEGKGCQEEVVRAGAWGQAIAYRCA